MTARKAYTATMTAACWREHMCGACGGAFRALLETSATSDYATPSEARLAALEAAEKLLADTVAMQPCPSCGLYQPDMVAQAPMRRHRKWTTIAAIAIVPLALIAGPQSAGSIMADILTIAVTIFCAAAAFVHIRTVLHNPNRDLAANRAAATGAIGAGWMEMLVPGIPNPATAKQWRSRYRTSRLLACAASILGALLTSAGVLFVHAHNWPVNEHADPVIAGPGDDVKLTMVETITPLEGLWRATAKAQVANAGELGLADTALQTTSNLDVWHESISRDFSLIAREVQPWAIVTLPATEMLAGRRIWIQVDLAAHYPDASGSVSFHNADTTFSDTYVLQLAAPHAARDSVLIRAGGLALGSALVIAAGYLLHRLALRESNLALPTRTISLHDNPIQPEE
ncbi:MAG: hypothetical protein JST22_13790 [Bacteroidetes bacterium]|nr:hypothetical protein [Bacteroidota bacterium]